MPLWKDINLSLDFLVDLSTEPDVEKRHCKLLLKAIEINSYILLDGSLQDVKKKEQIYPDALLLAALNRDPTIMGKLLEDGADVNQICNTAGECPLHIAAKKQDGRNMMYTMVEFLLNNGADVNKKTRSGLTPLHMAGSLDIINLLLEKGADLEAENNCGLSPLLWAIENKRPEKFIEHFLIQGARLDEHKLKENKFFPGKIVSELIVKCQVAKIDDDTIAKLDPSKELLGDSFEDKCKQELGNMKNYTHHGLSCIELLKENYTDFSFFIHVTDSYYSRFLWFNNSKCPIYYNLLNRNYNRAKKNFDSLLASTSDYVTIDAVGTPLNVTYPSIVTKRKVISSVPLDSTDTHKRMKTDELTDQ